MRVFVSRFTTDLHPGQGRLIDWKIGERVRVISGQDAGRIFVIQSQGMSHHDTPDDVYVRDGYFEDDPDQKLWAKSESVLWFN